MYIPHPLYKRSCVSVEVYPHPLYKLSCVSVSVDVYT